jgi:hypothetical protein
MLKNSEEEEAESLALATDKSVRFANEWSSGYSNHGKKIARYFCRYSLK